MAWILLKDGVIIQKQTKSADGFIEAADSVICGQIQEGDVFVNPPPAELTYVEKREIAYPSLQDQADMAYWDRQDGTTTLDDAIAAVKDTYPKD